MHASSEYLFSISKFGLITSKKLNICKADKMKHSPISRIKTWIFQRNKPSPGFKRNFLVSLELRNFPNIRYSFANFLEITNGKLCFLLRTEERKFGKDQNREAAVRVINTLLGIRLLQGFAKVKEHPQSSLVRLSLNVL